MSPAWEQITVRVPGKVMLAGEYTVLDGAMALAATVAAHLEVVLKILPADVGFGGGTDGVSRCRVRSALWPEQTYWLTADGGGGWTISSAPASPAVQPLLAAVARGLDLYVPAPQAGAAVLNLALEVDCALDPSFGIGSSSALRLGVLLAFAMAERLGRGDVCDGPAVPPPEMLAAASSEALALQRQAQRRASGYDLVTQATGGLVAWTPPASAAAWPGTVQRQGRESAVFLGLQQLAQVWVGGQGAPTGAVTAATRDWLSARGAHGGLRAANEALIAAMLAAFGDAAGSHSSDRSGDESTVATLARACGAQRQILAGAPSIDGELARLLQALSALPGCDERWSFKTTGAGGDDALLLLGASADLAAACQVLAQHGRRPLAAAWQADGPLVVVARAALHSANLGSAARAASAHPQVEFTADV